MAFPRNPLRAHACQDAASSRHAGGPREGVVSMMITITIRRAACKLVVTLVEDGSATIGIVP